MGEERRGEERRRWLCVREGGRGNFKAPWLRRQKRNAMFA
jgi:hypothetical protein